MIVYIQNRSRYLKRKKLFFQRRSIESFFTFLGTVKRIYRTTRREETWQSRGHREKGVVTFIGFCYYCQHTLLYKRRVGHVPNKAQKQVTASIFLLTRHNGCRLAQLKHKIGSSVYPYCRANRFKRICELGAMVTSKHGSYGGVRGMHRDSLGFRWKMWNGETKLGACKEFIKRLRWKNLPEGIFSDRHLCRMERNWKGQLREWILDLYSFVIVSRSVLLRMRNVSDKSCRENQDTYVVFIFSFENPGFYEIRWKYRVQPDRPQMKL